MTALHLEMWIAVLWAVKILWIIKQIILIILTNPRNYTIKLKCEIKSETLPTWKVKKKTSKVGLLQ